MTDHNHEHESNRNSRFARRAIQPSLLATFGAALAASTVSLAAEDPSAGRADATAHPAAVKVSDIDADLLRRGRIRLEAETRGASRVTFTYRTHRFAGRFLRTDEGKREWARTVRARGGDRAGRRIAIRVRACAGGSCITRSSHERLERPGHDRDD